jgi:hypothetical protein
VERGHFYLATTSLLRIMYIMLKHDSFHLVGAFDFTAARSSVDIDALAGWALIALFERAAPDRCSRHVD